MQIEINGKTYDGDALRRLAQRDTPAAVIAQAALQAGDHSHKPESGAVSPAAGD
jgi:hypothetical protein